MEKFLLKAPKAPCKSCPYRRDVPAGIWAESEYDKLERYDGEPFTQIDGLSLFMCHQKSGELCGGWLGCHGPHELLALRLHADEVDPTVFDYTTSVPLFESGAAAAEHGMSGIEEPDDLAIRTIDRIAEKRGLPKYDVDKEEDLS